MAADNVCETIDCENASTLQCPTCVKMGLKKSFFCSQDCFKKSWPIHKFVHKAAREASEIESYNPWPNYDYTGSLRPAPVTPYRPVPSHIMRPDYADHLEGICMEERNARKLGQIKILDDEEVEGLKVACKLARQVLDEAARAADIGVTTDEIDRVVHEAAIERECYPSPLNYYKFPKSVCTSVNEVICHGIPDMRPLQNGDLCNVDITVYHRGFHGDLNETLWIGEVDERSKQLTRATYAAISEAIDIVKPGTKFRDIGNVIQKSVSPHGFSVVRTYCGHGIHRLFHTAPNVPHYAKNKAVGVMKANQSFTIEPMINEGKCGDVRWPDDWTAATEDGRMSAQFEQTLLVTETGCEILTRRSTGQPHFMDKDIK